MKKKIFLSLLTLFTVFGIYKIQAETVSFSLGNIYEQETLTVGDIEYNKYVLSTENSTKYIIHNIEIGRYSEFQVVLHTQIYGEDAAGISTVLNMALDYEQKTGKTVYAAINGDFFGPPSMGVFAVDNNILGFGYAPSQGSSLGFTKAHRAVMGEVEYGFKANIYDVSGKLIGSVPIDKQNKELEDGEIGLYTNDLTSIISGENIAKLSIEDELFINNYDFHREGDVLSESSDFVFTDLDYTLSDNEFVLAAKGDSKKYQELLSNLEKANRIAIYPYPINDFEDMDYIISGYQTLIKRGEILPDSLRPGALSDHPRTTIGVSRDGTIGLTVVDGRMVDVPGVTLPQLASINESFGYFYSLELDGGGSSTMLLRNLETNELEVMNTPSDGHLRKVVNAILVVGDALYDDETTTTEITTDITTTTEMTTSIHTTTFIPTTTLEDTNTTSSTTNDKIDKNETGCFLLGYSTIIYSTLSLLGFVLFRKRM